MIGCFSGTGKQGTDGGQAVVAFVLLISALVIVAGFTVNAIRAMTQRVALQNAADAASLTGASMLADGLNVIATCNAGILALYGSLLAGNWDALEQVKPLQAAQDAVQKNTPRLALAAAVAEALKSGADGAVPLNSWSGKAVPDLMVKRVYLLPAIFGTSFPLWMKDTFQSGKRKPHGDRFLRVGVWRNRTHLPFDQGRNAPQSAVAEAAVWGERVLGSAVVWPPPVPRFKARLVEVTPPW